MSTAANMVRLQLNWKEVSGLTRAFTYTPETPIDAEDLPAVYPLALGRQSSPVPRTGPGQYIVERQYTYRLLIAPIQAASTESGDLGAYVDELAANIIDAATDYFMTHPRLHTDSGLGELAGLHQDISIQDSGTVTRPGPGGAQYRAIDYTLTIAERRIPTPARLA